ncbi:colicin E3/pyocin S6 family cytotoxin, partial [Salmonella enterica]|uniref:colicin E3/pyocin S6 family cytotoxin n=1 Tax=Salmonella enterica TaxID=28901 RepID=UPI003FA1D27E
MGEREERRGRSEEGWQGDVRVKLGGGGRGERKGGGKREGGEKKEEKKRSAENKLNEERNKPRKGTKDYGHDYLPVPETEEIKGLGDIKKGIPKTPKQNGGGKRKRWIGDKG